MAIGYIMSQDDYIALSTDDINSINCYEGTKIYLYDTKKTKIYHVGVGWVDYEYPTISNGGGSSVIEDGSIITSMFAEDAKTPLAGMADSVVSVTTSKISDATSVGKSVLTATDQASARASIGAGTSNIALGTTGTTALAGNGNAVSATKLQTARAIGLSGAVTGTANFDGTTAITIATTATAATISTNGVVKQAAAQSDSIATDVTSLAEDFNALLAKLRTAGIMA